MSPDRTGVPSRNAFLDFIRGAALVRVVVWHTFAAPVISFVAAMPVMFFTAAALTARSIDRGGAVRTLRSRFRRLLLPLWAFAVVAWTVMGLHALFGSGSSRTLHWWQPFAWLVPFWDPVGSGWARGLWVPLWYLRAIVWLLLLSPLLLRAFRRVPALTIAAPLVAVALFEYRARTGGDTAFQLRDLALFSLFWLLGFAYHDGHLARLGTWARVQLALMFGGLAVWWFVTQPVPRGIVNASYPAHLFVGLAWLFAALAFERGLERVATSRFVAPVLNWLNERPLTIYLWHGVGFLCVYQLVWARPYATWVQYVAALPVMVAVTSVCVLAFGWVEDVGTRRRPRLWPTGEARVAEGRRARRPRAWRPRLVGAVAILGVVVIGAATVSASTGGKPAASAQAHALPPSGAAVVANAQRQAVGTGAKATHSGDTSESLDSAAPNFAPPISSEPVTPAELQAVLDEWFPTSGFRGVVVAVRKPGQPAWAGVDGTDSETGRAMAPEKQFNITSMTKAFTATLILQLVQEGSVGLDDKLSKYVPPSYFSHAREITIRELLMHTAGVDPGDGQLPPDDLAKASKKRLSFKPGKGWEYSSNGIMLLGLVVEKATGQTYTEAVHQRITEPLGLASTFMDDEIGAPPTHRSSTHPYRDRGNGTYHGTRWATGGLYSTVSDLTAFAGGLFGGSLLAPDTVAAMTDFDSRAAFYGLGIHAYCPCWLQDGRVQGVGWGHYGGYGLFEYEPSEQVAIAIYPDPTYDENDDKVNTAFDRLVARILDVVRGRPLATG